MRKRSCILFLCLVLPMLPLSGVAAEPTLITDFNQFMAAVRKASDGDVLLVGDMDFSPLSPDVPISAMYITVDKSITVKSGKTDGPASFLNGAFLLTGSKIAGKAISVTFENIHFDGKADYSRLTEQDFAPTLENGFNTLEGQFPVYTMPFEHEGANWYDTYKLTGCINPEAGLSFPYSLPVDYLYKYWYDGGSFATFVRRLDGLWRFVFDSTWLMIAPDGPVAK